MRAAAAGESQSMAIYQGCEDADPKQTVIPRTVAEFAFIRWRGMLHFPQTEAVTANLVYGCGAMKKFEQGGGCGAEAAAAPAARVLCGSGAGRRAALAPAPLSPGLAGGGGSSAEGGAAVRLAGGGSGSGPRVGWAWYGQRVLRRAPGRSPPPLSGVRCAALGLARFGAATDERLASEGWRTQAWPPMLASPTKKKKKKSRCGKERNGIGRRQSDGVIIG